MKIEYNIRSAAAFCGKSTNKLVHSKMNMMKKLIFIFGISTIIFLFTPMHGSAYHGALYQEYNPFDAPASIGGGGGLTYAGSPRTKKYDCTICHINPTKNITLSIITEGEYNIFNNYYDPQIKYAFVIQMKGENRGFDSASNINTFALEAIDSNGVNSPVTVVSSEQLSGENLESLIQDLKLNTSSANGSWIIADEESFTSYNNNNVLSSKGKDEITYWWFYWLSPKSGAGTVTFYVSAVDGNGMNDPVNKYVDPLGDDVYTISLKTYETGTSIPSSDNGGGCSNIKLANKSRIGSYLILLVPFIVFLINWKYFRSKK